MKPRHILILLLGLFSEALYAQQPEPFFRQYTIEQGLPSNNVYRIHRDKKGYLWFATDNGISRFDGHHFAHYTRTNGFTDFGAYHIVEDKRGRIWFLTFSGRVCYFENGSFHNIDSTFAGRQHVKWIMEDEDGELFFTTRTRLLAGLHGPADSLPERFTATHGLATRKFIYAVSRERLFIYERQSRQWTLKPLLFSLSFSRIWQLSGGKLLVADDAYLYELRDKVLYPIRTIGRGKDIDAPVICLYENAAHDIWLGTSRGLYIYEGGDFSKKPVRYRPETNVLSITQDHENNYWISSGGQDVFKLNKASGSYFSTREGLSEGEICAISVAGGKTLVAHQFSDVFDWIDSAGKITSTKVPGLASTIYVVSLIPLNDKYVVLQYGDSQMLIGPAGPRPIPDKRYWITRKLKDDVLLSWGYDMEGHGNAINELRLFPDKSKSVLTRRALVPHNYEFNHVRVLDIWIDQVNAVWICSEHHLYRVINRRITIVPLSRNNEIITPKRILPVKNNRIWIATKGAGIFCLDTSGKVLSHISEAQGLASDNCTSIEYNGNDRIWVASLSGISIINLDNGKISVLNKNNLLPSNQIVGLAYENNKWHIGTLKGVLMLDEYVELAMNKQVPPPIYIEEVNNNGKIVNGDTIQLSFDHNALTVNFTGICFTDADKIKYQYRLNQNAWTVTSLGSVVLSALAPGSYLFEVLAVDGHGISSLKPARIWIRVSPPFWRTWWFVSLVFLVASGIVLLAIFIRINRLKQQNMLEKKLLRTELQMLHLQMNPHFLFNTLQSIQHYILEHRRELAVSYLAKFSKLMRLILNHSKRSSISLTEEINFLNLYIELEQLRFNDQFSYQVNLFNIHDPEEIRIPPMVVQPFVENAIKYGLNYRKIEGRLDVGFSLQTPTRLKVTIEDNGVGRAAVKVEQERFGKEFASTGISHTRDRMMALFDYDELHLEPIEIIDLYDAWNIPCGTRVILHIPV